MLGWSQTKLAEAAGLSLPTIKRYETGAAAVSAAAIASVRSALEAAGILFIASNGNGPGVRLRDKVDGGGEGAS